MSFIAIISLIWHSLLPFQALPFPGPGMPSSSGNTPFITGQTLGTPRNNITGCVGFEFTVGGSSITVTDVGRWVISGNSGTHNVTIQVKSSSALVAQASVNTSGATAAQYLYASVTPAVLSASTTYWIGSDETNGGDQFYDDNTTYTSTAVATPGFSNFAFSSCPVAASQHNSGAFAYVPVNFKYH